MARILRGSIAAGTAAVPLFFLIGFARSTDSMEFSMNLLTGVLLSSAFVWIAGASCAFVLLIPLIPIVDRARPVFSIALFLLLGLSVPSWLMFQSLHIGSHGNPPPIVAQPWSSLALSVASAGVVGLGSALASWFSTRKTAPRRENPNA